MWTHARLDRPGGHLRLGAWPSPTAPVGTVLLFTGRNETIEKYGELAGEFAARGWRVAAMDWRGQGGSSRWLKDRHKGHAPDFDAFLDDLDEALPRMLDGAADGPVLGFGHSMGGHILLRYLLERRHPFARAILSAPMLGIRTPMPEGLARRLAAGMTARGRGEDYTFGQGGWSPETPRFDGNPLTSDPVRFLVGHQAYVADPELALGGVTWGWLDAAFRSLDRMFRIDRPEECRTPILLMTGGKDRIVRADRHREMAARLPDCRHITYPQARHELLMEADLIRDQVWADMDAFLAEAAGNP